MERNHHDVAMTRIRADPLKRLGQTQNVALKKLDEVTRAIHQYPGYSPTTIVECGIGLNSQQVSVDDPNVGGARKDDLKESHGQPPLH